MPDTYRQGVESDDSDYTRDGFDATVGVKAAKVNVVTKGIIQSLPESAYSKGAKRTDTSPAQVHAALVNTYGSTAKETNRTRAANGFHFLT